MEKLFFLDTSGCEEFFSLKANEDKLLSFLPAQWQDRIAKTKNPELRHTRILTYSLLMKALLCEEWKILPNNTDNIPNLYFTEQGKPYINGASINISVSHTSGASLVAISNDEGVTIGVDIEEITDRGAIVSEKFNARYTRGNNISFGKLSDVYGQGKCDNVFSFTLGDYGIVSDGKCDIAFVEPISSSELSIVRWSATEALLKAEGGGFASLPSLAEIIKKSTVLAGVTSYKNKSYAVSVVMKI